MRSLRIMPYMETPRRRGWFWAFFILALIPALGHPGSSTIPPSFDVPLTGQFASAPISKSGIRVISWNIDRGYRFNQIAATLRREEGDICLLQEVDLHARRTEERDVARDLASALGDNYAFGIEFQELSQGNAAYHGQATLSRFPIVASRVLRFRQQSGFWNSKRAIPNVPLFQRRRGGRIALVTELQIGGSLVVVYNLHLESRSAGSIQAAQLDEVLADIGRYPRSTPVIIGGDLKFEISSIFRAPHIGRRRLPERSWRKDRADSYHYRCARLDFCARRVFY